MKTPARILMSLVLFIGIAAWKFWKNDQADPLPTVEVPAYVMQLDGYAERSELFDMYFQGTCVRVARLNGISHSAFEAPPIDPIEYREQILSEMAMFADMSNEEPIAQACRDALEGD